MNNKENHIAVIGMACRFPGANRLTTFWENLENNKNCIHYFTDTELVKANLPIDIFTSPNYVKARGILEGVDLFDAGFFGLSSYEASIMDPQHRIFIELCWEALEQAGYCTDEAGKSIGVFAGMSDSSYLLDCLYKNQAFLNSHSDYETKIATGNQFLATKVSYHLNLRGPSINISTACSTSLVSIIKACKSLLSYDCDIALAGGISIKVPQERGYIYQEDGIFSPDGKCRAFDKGANGTVSSNGAGVVVLKRLQDALNDRDNIDAIVISHAINNDGSAKNGYTAPSVIEQSRCIAAALANVNVDSISYIETHGTGTTLGDPIEIAALTKAFQHYTQKKQYCAIGTVKANIGHTDTAAGVAGFIKTVLCLKHRKLPACLHFQVPNPLISFSNTPFYVNQKLKDWTTDSKVLRAGVSSFGIGGTNAHLILEEAPYQEPSGNSRKSLIFSFSAKSPTALLKQQKQLSNHLIENKFNPNQLADIAYTLHTGRREFAYRQSFIGSNQEELLALIKNNIANLNNLPQAQPKIAFLFPGQGTIYPGIAKDFYGFEPFFKEQVAQCCLYLKKELCTHIINYLTNSAKHVAISSRIQQLSLFILEYCLAKTLMHLGITPRALLGHSLGEYVAACLSGVLTLQTAIQLIDIRGRLTDTLPPGAMLAVPLPEAIINRSIKNLAISIAAINTHDSCVISGAPNDIEKVRKSFDALLKNKDEKCILLSTTHAFHSKLVEPILEPYQKILDKIKLNKPNIPYLSNVTGGWLTEKDLSDTRYFSKHLRNPVLFSRNISYLLKEGYNIFVEIGSGNVLTTLLKQHITHESIVNITTLPSQKEYTINPKSQMFCLQLALSTCWENHIPIHWHKYYEREIRNKMPLPTYPFEKRSFWISPSLNYIKDPNNDAASIYKTTWEASNRLLYKLSAKKIKWLIFSDNSALSNHLINNELMTASSVIIQITISKNFSKLSDRNYQINPFSKENYMRLFTDLEHANLLPDNIIHCWSLTDNSIYDNIQLHESLLIKGFISLVYIAQCFPASKNKLAITIITNQLESLLEQERVIPEKGAIAGICLSIPQEYENITCKIIDMDPIDNVLTKELKLLPDILSTEGLHNNIIAYRSGIRFTKKYKKLALPNKSLRGNAYLKPAGIYIITGGLGKIGIGLASFLASQYSAHIILIHRTKFPPKNQWHSISGTNEYVLITNKLKKIEQHAASLLLIQANVASKKDMKIAFNIIRKNYQQLDGIFHLAASIKTAKNLIKDLDIEHIKEQLIPKIQGIRVIDTLIKQFPPKFVAVFSSISSVIGGAGLSSYAASNRCLDSFTQYKNNETPYAWFSLGWDAWDAFSNPYIILQRILQTFPGTNLIISSGKLIGKIKASINPSDTFKTTMINPDRSEDLIIYQEFTDIASIKKMLNQIYQQHLGIEGNIINDDASFYELGGNSLMAIRLLELIEKIFKQRIKLAEFANNNSITELAQLLLTYKKAKEISPYIITLNSKGLKEPLFLIHPIGGTIFCYSELAKYLPTDHPCYAIQDPAIDNLPLRITKLEDMANLYLKHIQYIQPHGPYYIGGYSFGASVAFEIARQLLKTKQEVCKLFLIDGWANFSEDIKNYENFLKSMKRTIENIKSHIADKISDTQHILEVAWARMQMLLNYKPEKIEAHITLFKAQIVLPEYQATDDATNHWQQYTTFPVKVYTINGDHVTILKGKGANKIGATIKQVINNNLRA